VSAAGSRTLYEALSQLLELAEPIAETTSQGDEATNMTMLGKGALDATIHSPSKSQLDVNYSFFLRMNIAQ
jgi:hypothetical protein